ncbi:MAG: phosphoglycerate kinase [Bacteroidetes bacterium]|nr:phosphoglycerate kinase [Bacteroidota bacterium]
MKTIDTSDFSNKKVLIRVDFNVRLDEQFQITDDTRIRMALPTIQKVLASGGSAILMSHLGRPDNGPADEFSLKHLVPHLSKLLDVEVKFAKDCVGKESAGMASKLQPGEVLLLENLRFHVRENMGDEDFAKSLANLADSYINDAFGVAHRGHASNTVITKYFNDDNKMFGYLIAKELENAEKMMNNITRPFTVIVGGAKISDKILVLERLLDQADHIIFGGGMAFTFLRASGVDTGNSLVEEDRLDVAKSLMETAKTKNVQLHFPQDSVIAAAVEDNIETSIVDNTEIPPDMMGLDIGPVAAQNFSDIIKSSKQILWNGTMGVCENDLFINGTKTIGDAVVEATKNGAYSLIGGGDTVAAINKLGLADKVSYVSTGGGALLTLFEGKVLPAIKAISDPVPA